MTPRQAYADTSVPVANSHASIRKLLQDYGASDFRFGESLGVDATRVAVVEFVHEGLAVRMRVPFREHSGRAGAAEKEERRIWRVIFHTLKARLVAVEAGVETLEEAFLAHVVNPATGRTVYESLSTDGLLQLPAPLPALPHGSSR